MSIYSTAEADAWGRDFDYAEYLDLHSKRGCVSRVFTEAGYKEFRQLLDREFERECDLLWRGN